MSLHYHLTLHQLDRPSPSPESYQGPKQHFFRSFALKTLYNFVHLRKKHLISSMTLIYFVARKKIQTGSPDPGPNLRRKSSQRSLQGAGPALLLRPCWCFPHYVFFSLLLIFCISILAIAKIQIQKEGKWILIKYIDILHQNISSF